MAAQRTALLLLLGVTSALALAPPLSSGPADFIRTCCGATLYPTLCYASLAGYAGSVQMDPVRLAQVAANVSLDRVRSVQAHVSSLSRPAAAREGAALRDCAEVLGIAADLTWRSTGEIGLLATANGPEIGFRVSNAQTWMSAALTNEDTCTDSFSQAGPSPMSADVCERVRRTKQYTSNALALLNHLVASRR